MIDERCGCCKGLDPLTPLSTANRPGRDALTYRVGTHATFLETMKARLSSSEFPSLRNLKTREADDFSVALLDAWATVADVLTFYQERIANEGYLRTATERRSVSELAGLVGYKLRPGVSASVYPAFTLEQGYKVDIPQGTRAKSLPDSGEMPQSFETAETLAARSEWNELKPRLKKPQNIHQDTGVIYFQGTATNLKPNDTLLLDLGETKLLRRVKTVELQGAENRTKVTLQAAPPEENQMNNGAGEDGNGKSAFEKLLAGSLTQRLSTLPSRQPSNRLRLPRNVQQTFQLQSDVAPRLLSVLKPTLGSGLYQAWQNLPVTAPAQFKVYVFRAQAAPFGHNAPLRPDHYNQDRNLVVYGEWRIDNPLNQTVVNQPARLSAGFSTQPDPPTGINSLTVQFTNQSEGDITEYSWDFGDGATSRERNPEHTFSVGTYTVILTVSGSLGTSTARTTVRVNYLG